MAGYSTPQLSVEQNYKMNSGFINRGGKQKITTSIPTVPITVERRPFIPSEDSQKLLDPGTARANIAPSVEQPNGTLEDDWAARHQHQSVLQQHCEFFDTDRDGILWPSDTYNGFRRLGFGIFLSLVALFIIHLNFSYVTQPSWLPDPFYRIYLVNVHKTKHGSDSGTFDHEGRFIPQRFEDIFTKYADGKDSLNFWDMVRQINGQRLVSDPIGWGGAIFEWSVTYIMLWPEDGEMRKEDIRRVFDGSLFYTIAARRARNQPPSTGDLHRAKRCQVLESNGAVR
ncbi:putative peroxygenase 3 [Exophiala dermatitidis]